MKLYTIGFTKKSAEQFFDKLTRAGVKRLVDTRLNNVSQLAGFAKKDDLRYFSRLCGLDYVHLLELAPTDKILDDYRKHRTDWYTYERLFLDLISKRSIETTVPRDLLSDACLLCSEEKPDRCHRRLVAEFLRTKWDDVEIHHIR